jgi:hypothetical protein
MEKDDQPKINSELEMEDSISILNSMLQKATEMATHFDIQINILIGIGLAVVAISVSHLDAGNNILPFSILVFFSVLSTIASLYAIYPPKRMRKRGQEDSLFYNKKVTSFSSEKKYDDAVRELLADRDSVIFQYSTEIYNIYKYHYRPKRELFKLARNLLISGIVLGLISYILLLIK